jgi:preprotein translocase subunit SecD
MSLRAKVIWISTIAILMALLAFPSFFTEDKRRSSLLIPDQGISLGLDLQGGIHWLLKIP